MLPICTMQTMKKQYLFHILLLYCSAKTINGLLWSKCHRQRLLSTVSFNKRKQGQQPWCGMDLFTGRSLSPYYVSPVFAKVELHMHMGHSHSHHDHSHDLGKSPLLSTCSGNHVKSSVRIRRFALYLFCFVLTLGRPILSTVTSSGASSGTALFRGQAMLNHAFRAIRISDIAAFVISAASFSFFIEPISRELKSAIKRLQDLGSGIAKHAPPSTSFFSLTRMLLNSPSPGGSSSINEETSKYLAADRVTILGGFMNIVLSVAKFLVGVQCHSSALIADAGHSLSDLFSDFITLWAVQVGRLPPDDDHPYGHGKFEAIGALFLALTLLGTGVSVGIVANHKLIEIIALQRSGQTAMETHLLPRAPALAMAFLSILSKEWLFRVTLNVGERINSQVVIANAWHHRSDAYSSVLALFSIGLAMAGIAAADAAAGLLVAGMICMTGAEILGESVKQLTDHSDDELVRRITGIVANSKDVESVNRIRARQVGSASIIDLSICIPERLASVSEARVVEERLRKIILQEAGVLDCDVKATARRASSKEEHSSSTVQSLIDEIDELTRNPERMQTIISKAEVEISIRDAILKDYPQVQSIKGITIHYQDVVTDPIDVDVDICLDGGIGESATIASAAILAQNVRETLEKYEKINTASIFLDLNFQIPTTTIART